MECFYCEKSERLYSLMVPVCELDHANVYMLKNQNYPGRCVVAFKGGHKTELYQLTAEELFGFTSDVARVAKAISEVYHPDKINYGIYGDEVPHLHYHLVPKTKGCLAWGSPFEMSGGQNILSDEEMAAAAAAMRTAIMQTP